MSRAVLAAAATLLVAVSTAGASPDFGGMQVTPYDPPKPAPAFSLPDLEGHARRLEDARGKVILLFFWATW